MARIQTMTLPPNYEEFIVIIDCLESNDSEAFSDEDLADVVAQKLGARAVVVFSGRLDVPGSADDDS